MKNGLTNKEKICFCDQLEQMMGARALKRWYYNLTDVMGQATAATDGIPARRGKLSKEVPYLRSGWYVHPKGVRQIKKKAPVGYQAAIAEITGVVQDTVSRMLRGILPITDDVRVAVKAVCDVALSHTYYCRCAHTDCGMLEHTVVPSHMVGNYETVIATKGWKIVEGKWYCPEHHPAKNPIPGVTGGGK